jgi:two-component system, NarL family, nitrate/nitrite response regulator NarL
MSAPPGTPSAPELEGLPRPSLELSRLGPSVRVLLVDPQHMFTDALGRLLRQGAEVREEAEEADDALVTAPHRGGSPPDVVLLDIAATDVVGGIDAILASPTVSVVIVTARGDPEVVARSIEPGDDGPSLGTGGVAALLSVLGEVSEAGTTLTSGEVTTLGTLPRSRKAESGLDDTPPRLTAREVEILQQLVNGYSTVEAAQSLHISPLTVRSHVKSILAKLGVHSKLEAVTYAIGHGLVQVRNPA